MAEGLGDGWDEKYDYIKDNVESGLHFSTATVAGGTGANSAQQSGNSTYDIVLNITNELDGAVLSRRMRKYNVNEERLHERDGNRRRAERY